MRTAIRKLYRRFAISISALGLIVLGPSGAAVAAEKASEQVSAFYGSFSNGVPIDVPAFHGLEPRIALGYSSEGRNGFVGVGWGLSGFSAVQRANPGMGTPRFDSTDIFMLDGQELIPCGPSIVSPSCATGGTHTTKIESYLRIRFDSVANEWTVWGKDGTRTILSSTFEVPGNSLVVGGTLRWGQTNVVDTKGNTVTYNWAAQDGDVYPDSVEYNGYRVKIYRESRPDPQSFAAASILGHTRYRVRSVLVQLVSGASIRAYKLTYTASAVTGRSLLSAVQQYGKDVAIDDTGLITAGTTLPARTFTYQNDSLGKTFQGWESAPSQVTTEPVNWARLVNVVPSGTGNSLTKTAGVDGNWDAGAASAQAIASGDGYLEFIASEPWRPVGRVAGLSNGDTDVSPQDVDFGFFEDDQLYVYENGVVKAAFPWQDGDVLRVEVTQGVVSYKKNGLLLYTSAKDPTYPLRVDASIQTYTTIKNAVISGLLQEVAGWCQGTMIGGDFNGDGRSDQLCMTALSSDVKVRLMTADGFAAPTTWQVGGVDRVVLGDFNSDGKTDLGNYVSWPGEFSVALSNGHAFEPPVSWGSAVAIDPVDNQQYACRIEPATVGTGDFNGDGWTDVFCQTIIDKRIFVGISNGSSFTFGIWGQGGCDVWDRTTGAMDFDGDGKDDWYCIGEQNARFLVSPSTGSGFGMSLPGSLDASFCDAAGYVLGDLNADGRADAACVSNGKVALSLGRGFLEAGTFGAWCSGSTNFFASDVDGDGASEIVCNNPAAGVDDIQVRKWQNDSLGAAETWKGNWCTGTVGGGDYNGDGKADLFCNDSSGAPAVAGSGGFVSDLMSTATNGMGGTVGLAYTSSTAFENVNNPGPKFTVTSLTTQDGRGGSSTTTYSYSGGLMDRFERRFLGYRQVRKTLPCIAGETACPYVDTWLQQDLASAGAPERVEYHNGAGQLLTASESQYTTNGTTVPRVSLLTGQFAYTYDGAGSCQSWPCASGKRTYSSYVYDSFGNATSSASWGDYDAGGDEVTVRRTYYPNATDYIVDRVALEQQLAGAGMGPILTQTEYWYDGQGAGQPPTQGFVTTTRGWLDTESRWVSRAMGYDNWGNMTSVTDETGLPTTVAYDAVYHTFPISATNPALETESGVWDPACGVPTQKTNANNQSSTFQYDNLCRLTRTDLPLGAFEWRDYLDVGDPNLQRTWVRTPPAVAGTGKQYVMDYFDGLGRTYRSIVKGPAANQRIFSDTTFNARGQVASQSAPYYENETPANTTYSYDAMDRLIATTFPDTHQLGKTYGLWSETTSDEHGHPTTTTYDAYGRARTKDNWLSGQQVRTQFSYDRLGQLVGTEDALGNIWSWTFDSLGRNVQKNDPDAGIWTFAYDDASRLKKQIDAKSQRIDFTYDPAGRLLTKTPIPDTLPPQAVTMAYGEARTGFFNVGRLTTVHNVVADEKTDYDALGRPVKQMQTLAGVPYTVERRYDAGGRLRGITYPDGEAVGTTANPLGYDQAGRLTSIPGIVTEVLYDAAGRPTRQTNGNGTLTERGYSTRGFLTGIRTGGPALVQDLTYQPDAAGLLQQVTSSLPDVPNEAWAYVYDDLHRLTSASNLSNPPESQWWSLDAIGRITYNSRVGSYTYPAAPFPRPHAPSSVAGNQYDYDDNGNLTSGGGRTPQWNVYNQPTSIGGTQFLYDGLGERVSKTSTQGTSLYPMGDDYEVTKGVVTKYISMPGLGVVAKRRDSRTYWMHTDRLGSIQAITDNAGSQVWRKSYRPYGETITETTGHEESRGWIDQRQDQETGLTYLHARYYDPTLGVFLSPDPLHPAKPGVGWNRYGYAFGNPVNGTDRSGLNLAFWICEHYGQWFADWCNWSEDHTISSGGAIVPISVSYASSFEDPFDDGESATDGDGGGDHGGSPDDKAEPQTTPQEPPPEEDLPDECQQDTTGQSMSGCQRPQEEPTKPEPKPECAQTFGGRFTQNFKMTNAWIPGFMAPTGGSLLSGAASKVGATTGRVTLFQGTELFVAGTANGTIASGNAAWLAEGAGTSAASWVAVGLAFEVGVGVGSFLDASFYSLTCR